MWEEGIEFRTNVSLRSIPLRIALEGLPLSSEVEKKHTAHAHAKRTLSASVYIYIQAVSQNWKQFSVARSTNSNKKKLLVKVDKNIFSLGSVRTVTINNFIYESSRNQWLILLFSGFLISLHVCHNFNAWLIFNT